MKANGFMVNDGDNFTYNKGNSSKIPKYKRIYMKGNATSCIILCMYVENMLIMRTRIEVINSTKRLLNSYFYMKDLGRADVILGIQIKISDDNYILSQSYY